MYVYLHTYTHDKILRRWAAPLRSESFSPTSLLSLLLRKHCFSLTAEDSSTIPPSLSFQTTVSFASSVLPTSKAQTPSQNHHPNFLLIYPAMSGSRLSKTYRDRLKGVHNWLSNSQAGPGRKVKQEQEEISRNHVQAF